MTGLTLKDVMKKAESGPICMQNDFDLKILNSKVKEVIKDYDIKFNSIDVIPDDNSLADDIFNAALDLYLETGTYCVSTHRQIKFEETEIKEALRNAPKSIIFGQDEDKREMIARKIEDSNPPLCLTSGGCEISEEIYVKLVQSYAQEPLSDTISGGFPLKTIFGMDPNLVLQLKS